MKIFADTANVHEITTLAKDSRIAGFTTNPSLMRKNGITDYAAFAKTILSHTNKPVSFEVFADEFDEMERQARIISSWGGNIYVKIPITNTRGESSLAVIDRLCGSGVKVNVTAIFSPKQSMSVATVLHGAPAIVSIFAGRIADAGYSPAPICMNARKFCSKNVEILWASTRELINIKQAEGCGCDIITVPNDLLKKMHLIGKDLTEYSLETVQQFYDDAKASGFSL